MNILCQKLVFTKMTSYNLFIFGIIKNFVSTTKFCNNNFIFYIFLKITIQNGKFFIATFNFFNENLFFFKKSTHTNINANKRNYYPLFILTPKEKLHFTKKIFKKGFFFIKCTLSET